MAKQRMSAWVAVVCLLGAVGLRAQSGPASDADSAASAGVVPRLIKFSGEINSQTRQNNENESAKNQPATPIAVTFSLYELQQGGSPLWSESQKVQVGEQGHYTVLLGATEAEGLPLDLFSSGKALWLGVQPQLPGATEQPRVLLVAVPYALKAADSDTLGGKPASAYALAGGPTLLGPTVGTRYPSSSSSAEVQSINPTTGPTTGGAASAPQPSNICGVLGDSGSQSPEVALYSGQCQITEDKNFVDAGGNVGIGTRNPNAPLNVLGTFTSTTVSQFAVNVGATWTPAANTSVAATGLIFEAGKGGTFNSTSSIGLRGIQGLAYNEGSGAVTGLAGIIGAVENIGPGTVTNAYSLDLLSPEAGTSAPITNSYGLLVQGQKVAGVTNGYGIYATGASDINYFAGGVGIGTTTPTASLEVNGTAKFDSLVTVTDLTAGNCVQAGAGGLLTTTGSPCGSGGGGGGGTITGVTAGPGLQGGGTSGTVSLSLIQTCASGQVLVWSGFVWACGAAVGGTVTSVGSGPGLTGGPITGSGTLSIPTGGVTNAMLSNPALTVAAGTDLTGGGAVALGGVTTLNIDTTKVPQLDTANTFTGTQTLYGDLDLGTTGVAPGVINFGGQPFISVCCHNPDYDNTFIGINAGENVTTGDADTAIGYHALFFNTTGSNNAASGFYALLSNTTGIGNTASGNGALRLNAQGDWNTAMGAGALTANTTGNDNTAVGYNAGVDANGFTLPSTGSNSTFVGAFATATLDGLTNAAAIGACASVSASSALVLGAPAAQGGNCGTYPNTLVGIDVPNPSNIFTVLQGGGQAISDGWSTYSSRRWKRDIQPLQGALGKVERLRGVSYTTPPTASTISA